MRLHFLFFLFVIGLSVHAQPDVHVAGAMKNTMWNGQLGGLISLDTLNDYNHLYGIGPLEYLAGELLILDGVSYVATVGDNGDMVVREAFEVKAPFFVYSQVKRWEEVPHAQNLSNLEKIEDFLDSLTLNHNRPFAFKMTAVLDSAVIHLMNLPKGAIVKSPADAHATQVNYWVKNTEVILVGFFSRNHKTIFTHHDTFMHLHLITRDEKFMGHVDNLYLKPGSVKLYLPSN